MSSPSEERGKPASSDVDALDRAASLGDATGLASASPTELPAVELDIWKLALPAVATNLLFSSVSFVGTMAVGSLGTSALAAVTAGERVFFILQAVLMAVTAGTTALVARAWGRRDAREAALVARASLWICIGVAAVATVLGLLLADFLVGIFELDEPTLATAARYIRCMMLFNVVFAVFISLAAALRAAGDTLTPLWVGAIANGLNVLLLFPFVYGSWGFESLGVVGAALAGGLAFSVASSVMLVMWWRGGLAVGRGGPGALSRRRVRELVRVGTPAGLEQLAFQLGFVVFLWVVSFYGDAAYAAYGIGVRILSFSFVVGFGFSIAASTLVGQHLGAGDPEAATRAGWRATRISLAVMVVFGLAIMLSAEPIARLMVDDDETVRLAVVFIYLLGSAQPLMAVEFGLSGALRGAGDTRFPFYAVLIGMLGVRCSLAALAAWLGLSVEWVFAALLGDWLVKALLLVWRFRSGRWQHVFDNEQPA